MYIQPIGIDGRRNLDLNGKIPALASEATCQRERNRLPGKARVIVGEDPQSLDARWRLEGLDARALMAAQTGTLKSSCAAMAVSIPSATPISAAASNRRHAPPLIVSTGGMSFFAWLDIAEKDPMCRLQPTIRPDNGRNDRRKPLLCFHVIKRGMPEQNIRADAKPAAAEIISHNLRLRSLTDEPPNSSRTLRGLHIFRRGRALLRRRTVDTSDNRVYLIARPPMIPLVQLTKQ